MLYTTQDGVACLAFTCWKVRISARKPSVLTDTLRGFAFSLQESAAVVPTIGYDHLIANYFRLVLHESESRRRCVIDDTESAVKSFTILNSYYWMERDQRSIYAYSVRRTPNRAGFNTRLSTCALRHKWAGREEDVASIFSLLIGLQYIWDGWMGLIFREVVLCV
jgi:hypothetical protein